MQEVRIAPSVRDTSETDDFGTEAPIGTDCGDGPSRWRHCPRATPQEPTQPDTEAKRVGGEEPPPAGAAVRRRPERIRIVRAKRVGGEEPPHQLRNRRHAPPSTPTPVTARAAVTAIGLARLATGTGSGGNAGRLRCTLM